MSISLAKLWISPTRMPTPSSGLVGIDEINDLVVAEASLLLNPARVDERSQHHHGSLIFAAREVKDRTPLLILAGKGLVGQMTALLGAAFKKISDEASKAVDNQGRVRRGIVLLIDEGRCACPVTGTRADASRRSSWCRCADSGN